MLKGLRKFIKQLETDAIVLGIVGLIIGALIILAIRFFTYNPPHTHYHANFAVYMNGQREQFKDPTYFESEGGSCNENGPVAPEERAHMHDEDKSVVHVHDESVTWGQFFTNIGWTVNNRLVQTRDKLYLPAGSKHIKFILNGNPVFNIENQVIGDRDKLLVDYGDSTADISKEYKEVPSTAKQADESKDPASCGGAAPATTSDKLHHLF